MPRSVLYMNSMLAAFASENKDIYSLSTKSDSTKQERSDRYHGTWVDNTDEYYRDEKGCIRKKK